MPNIAVSEETYSRLSQWAASRNQSVDEAVAPMLAGLVPLIPTPDEQRRAFEELTKLIESRADRYPPGFQVNDSRESIYEGCGE